MLPFRLQVFPNQWKEYYRLLFITIQKYISMEFGDLLRRRLKIAAQAAQTDPANPESNKSLTTVLVQCIQQQASQIQLIQAQLSDKVNSEEFKQVTGQKLSLREFLAYFHKVEKIVQKMESHWHSGQSRNQEVLQGKLQTFSQELQATLEGKFQQFYQQLLNNQRQLKTAKDDIINIQRQLQQIQSMCSDGMQSINSKMSEHVKQLSQIANKPQPKILPPPETQPQMSNQKVNTVFTQVKQMQIYLNQMHSELSQLMHTMSQENSISQKTQLDFNHRIAHCQNSIAELAGGSAGGSACSRWLWQWRPGKGVLECQPMNNQTQPQNLEPIGEAKSAIRIHNAGLHRLALGYLLESHLSELVDILNAVVRASIDWNMPCLDVVLLFGAGVYIISFSAFEIGGDRFFRVAAHVILICYDMD